MNTALRPTTTKVTVFQNRQFGEVRTIMRDGEPWFVAADVCRALEVNNSRDAVARLDGDEKTAVVLTDTSSNGVIQKRAMTLVSESGLYSLVLGSRKPEARLFKRWITHEVIPSIRKHGVYAIDQLLDNPDLLIASLQKLKAERERANHAEELAAAQGRLIEEMEPKATYYDLVLSSTNAVPITMIAKDYGLSAIRLNQILHDLGVQYKLDGTWILYQDYANCGYTKTQTHAISEDKSVIHTCWTQKGRLFIYDLLKNERDLLPLMERDEETTASDVFGTLD